MMTTYGAHDGHMTNTELSAERRDLLEALQAHRGLLLVTAQGLTEEQARTRSTVSALSVGGLIKHVAEVESGWATFMAGRGLPGMEADVDWSNPDPEAMQAYLAGFELQEDETLAGAIEHYQRVAAETDRLVATLPDLDASYPLPTAPWFPPDGRRSVRRAAVHIVAETAQHAGHADIIRETIDGARSMG
jgi:hypothetical protein